jgi:hypothetical protein
MYKNIPQKSQISFTGQKNSEDMARQKTKFVCVVGVSLYQQTQGQSRSRQSPPPVCEQPSPTPALGQGGNGHPQGGQRPFMQGTGSGTVESILNNRPLTYVTADSKDVDALKRVR